MRTFIMHRGNDESNISGVGAVLSGCILPSGSVVVEWHSKTQVNSLGIYKNYFEFYFIHCASHPNNNTQIVFKEEEHVIRENIAICRFCKNSYKEHPKDLQADTETKLRRSCSGNLVELEKSP